MAGSSLVPTVPLSSPVDKQMMPSQADYSSALAHVNSPQTPDIVSTTLGCNTPDASAKRNTVPYSHMPTELLLTLKRQAALEVTQVEDTRTKLPPVKGVQVVGSPANLWNHPRQRERFKHLTESTPCVCGAGGTDISFIYDTVQQTRARQAPKQQPPLPDTLIPEEYHLVKHPGVRGLQYFDDSYTTQPENHELHMTVFPSMKPAGRREAILLKQTLDQMLQEASVLKTLTDSDLKGPTQLHNLLHLIKKEQDIYNICFHELIRQVSIHCVERGEVLAELRRRYSNLLDRIPFQVKSLHNEIVAQRALDRRLADELNRFKNVISSLTSELSELREHDILVAEEAHDTQENLTMAISESEKNANLLAEYHELYELQRRRMEGQVGLLMEEKDLWQQACYSLALKVARQCQLQTLQRLQLSEKCWVKLAEHFAIFLSDKDTVQLSKIQEIMNNWKESVVSSVTQLHLMETSLIEELTAVEKNMQNWIKELKSIDSDGTDALGRSDTERLWRAIGQWQAALNSLSEQFSGELLLERQEQLQQLQLTVDEWSSLILCIMRRHPDSEEADDPDRARMPTNDSRKIMLSVNHGIDSFMKDMTARMCGENGVAVGFVHIITPMETWDTKLSLVVGAAGDKRMSKSDLSKFLIHLQQWLYHIHKMIELTGTSMGSTTNQPPAKERAGTPTGPNTSQAYTDQDLQMVVANVEKLQSAFSHAINSEDTRILDQVSRLHSDIVMWMVQLLLSLTSTNPSHKEATVRLKTMLIPSSNLTMDYEVLKDRLKVFTSMLTKSCAEIVAAIPDSPDGDSYADAEREQHDLRLMQNEAEEWVRLGKLLLEALVTGRQVQPTWEEEKEEEEKENKDEKVTIGREVQVEVEVGGEVDEESDLGQKTSTSIKVDVKEEVRASHTAQEQQQSLPKSMNVLGIDDNVHQKSLQQVIREGSLSPLRSCADLGLPTEQDLPEGRGVQQKDAELLVIALDESQEKLRQQEALREESEKRLEQAENQLKEAQMRVSQLEAEVQKLEDDAAVHRSNLLSKPTKKLSKSGQQRLAKQESRRK